MTSSQSRSKREGGLYTKTELVNGRPQDLMCVDLCEQTFEIHGSILKTAILTDEWFQDLEQPDEVVGKLAKYADLLSFWQRLPNVEPIYSYHKESELLAVLEVENYEKWWKKTIKSRIRTSIRKAKKAGVVVEEVPFDDCFVKGMTAIFNEAPVRQGRKFWHYGKDFETVRTQFGRFLHRETMIGAYVEEEMIGFVMLADAGPFALLGQILSSVRHRDKVPSNCLVAKAVEVASRCGHQYLVYGYWSDGSLSEFKRRCGFVPFEIPKYYVPLSWRGRLALKLGVHRGWKKLIPESFKVPLKEIRRRWVEIRSNRKVE